MNISVIVPVYNVAPWLEPSLDSLVAAACEFAARTPDGRVEVVCVDDGSTDGSRDMAERYARRFPPAPAGAPAPACTFILLRQANAGVSAARNAGLDIASGEVVTFLDPDDTVAPDWLTRLASSLGDRDWLLTGYAENGVVKTPGDAGRTYTDASVRRRAWQAFFGYRLRDLLKLPLPGGMWRWCRREMAGVWRCAIRRTALGDLRFDPRLKLYEDAMFLARLGTRAHSLAVTGDCGYRWTVRPSGAMKRQMREHRTANKFAVRDVRREIDPGMSHWRGTFLLSALEILRDAGPRTALRYLRMRPR